MALASLEVWLRMLVTGGAWRRIRPAYWPRLAVGLFTSTVGTLLTLPERLLLWPWLRTGKTRANDARGPELLFVLGYYRSGTTHLHYLLSADPRFATPKWYQTLAPAGFVLSWLVARWLLVPFLGSTRPQDDVAYGPEWPAEDDFAVNNMSVACTMPGRMVIPDAWEHYKRYNDLRGVSPAELARWRRAQWTFTKRVEWNDRLVRRLGKLFRGHAKKSQEGGGSREDKGEDLARPIVLLKTPAHTARVAELIRLFGSDHVRFIHLSRNADAVVRSNVAMHGRLEPYLLQPPPTESEIQRRIVDEYDRTERAFVADAAAVPPGRLARMRYEDLIADPIAEVRRCYTELGMRLSEEAEGRMVRYLRAVAGYRTALDRAHPGSTAQRDRDAAVLSPGDAERLAWMHDAFGHDRPARSKAPLPQPRANEPSAVRRATADGAMSAAVAALACGLAWIGLSVLAWDRMDWLIWPVGAVIGLSAVRGLESGSRRLGVIAALLTVLVMLLVAAPATAMTGDYRFQSPLPWDHLWTSIRRGVLAKNNLFWMFLGIVSAYRLASRRHLLTPGA